MRAGGMSESSKWKKQKRSPRPPRHPVRNTPGQMDPARPSTLSNNNLSGDDNTNSIQCTGKCEALDSPLDTINNYYIMLN